jgi:cystathionine gamma-synthase
MAVFTHLPLGVRIPSSPHAVSFSLPRLQDVRGYEQKSPETMRHITSGYPRFVVHPFARQLAAHLVATTPDLAEAPGRPAQSLWLTSSPRMAHALAAALERASVSTGASGIRVLSRDGLYGVSHPPVPDLSIRAKAFLQNIGGFLSSREAEDHLVRLGLLAAPHPEAVFAGDAAAEVRRIVQRALPEAGADDLLTTNCGMNAIYAAFRASAELQAKRGRTLWLQLGWLYLDTISILKKSPARPPTMSTSAIHTTSRRSSGFSTVTETASPESWRNCRPTR